MTPPPPNEPPIDPATGDARIQASAVLLSAAEDPSQPPPHPYRQSLPSSDSPPLLPSTTPAPHPRIPNLGHALLFLLLAGLLLLLTQGILTVLILPPASAHAGGAADAALHHPKLQIAAMALTYLATLTFSSLFFPLLWNRPFLSGLHWNATAARRLAPRLFLGGLALGWFVQALSSLIRMPKSIPLDDFFRSPIDVWTVTLFGTLLGPLAEEICFRGFLLPAFAIAVDWLRLPRTPDGYARWHHTDTLSTPALIASALLTSLLFALLHAQQLAHAWQAVGVLAAVSLVLTAVRIRTGSVAASTLVHASYNFSIFITLFLATGGYRHLDRMTR